ncbi:helix-turn-helix domain-containing protein [Treponema zioleckii]|uniref:helix-turn-helix domain-containing protein n=1 Tax=Treponema zioleckii TaxID=331680 RepID=UPI00168AF686|nr:helix-turn-helix transcriptional regulator [Treponema zioleckii]
MPQYSVGQSIKSARERKRISQSILCDGICSIATLSKIENGLQNPSATVMEALLERLGLPIGLYNVPVTKVRFKRSLLEQQIVDILADLGTDIGVLLKEYAELPEPMDKFEKQFYLFMIAIQKHLKNEPPQEILLLYIKALKITYPKYDLETLSNEKYFTATELQILNNIALEERRLGKKGMAEKILIFLKTYYESGKLDETSMEKEYPVVLANLSDWYESESRFTEEHEIAKTGLDFCIKKGKLCLLDVMAFNTGYSLINLGKKDEGIKYLDKAFSIMELKGQSERLQKHIEYVQKIIPYTLPTHNY